MCVAEPDFPALVDYECEDVMHLSELVTGGVLEAYCKKKLTDNTRQLHRRPRVSQMRTRLIIDGDVTSQSGNRKLHMQWRDANDADSNSNCDGLRLSTTQTHGCRPFYRTGSTNDRVALEAKEWTKSRDPHLRFVGHFSGSFTLHNVVNMGCNNGCTWRGGSVTCAYASDTYAFCAVDDNLYRRWRPNPVLTVTKDAFECPSANRNNCVYVNQ